MLRRDCCQVQYNIKNNKNKSSYKEPTPGELRKEIAQSSYVVNSIQKFRFPCTDVYPHLENESQISMQSEDFEN